MSIRGLSRAILVDVADDHLRAVRGQPLRERPSPGRGRLRLLPATRLKKVEGALAPSASFSKHGPAKSKGRTQMKALDNTPEDICRWLIGDPFTVGR